VTVSGKVAALLETVPGMYREEVLEVILCSVPVLVIDRETGEILYSSPALERTFGYGVHGELRGHKVDDLLPDFLHEREVNEARKLYAPPPEAPPVCRALPLVGQRKDHTLLAVEVGLSPVEISKRRCVLATVINMTHEKEEQDDTERTEMEGTVTINSGDTVKVRGKQSR
jgi:PAS domain S-box-containing protein